MPKQAIIGGVTHTFPDDATDAEIDAIAVSMLGGSGAEAQPEPAPQPTTKTINFEGKPYTFPADATIEEMDALLPKSAPSRLQQRKSDRAMRDLAQPNMIPQSTVAGDPNPHMSEDAGTFAAHTIGNIGQNVWDFMKTGIVDVSNPLKPKLGSVPAMIAKFGTAVGSPIDQIELAKEIGGGLKRDYGGIENIKQTIHDKPVQVALDVVALKGAVPGIVRGTGAAGRATAARLPGATAVAKDAATGLIIGGPKGAAANVVRGGIKRTIQDFFKSEAVAPTAEEALGLAKPEAASLRESTSRGVDVNAKPTVDSGRVSRERIPVPSVVVEAPKPKVAKTSGAAGKLSRERQLAEEAAERLRESMVVDGPERSALDLGRGRQADPVVERAVPEAAPAIELGDDAARLRESVATEGPDTTALDLQRGRQASPPAVMTRPKPAAVPEKAVSPSAGPMGEDAMANDKLKRLMGTKPNVAPKQAEVAPKSNVAPKLATQPDVTTTPKAEAPKAEPLKEALVKQEVEKTIAEHNSKSKTARGGHRLSENDKKVLAENIRQGLSDDAAWADMLKQYEARKAANKAGAPGSNTSKFYEAKKVAEAPKAEAPTAEAPKKTEPKPEAPKKTMKEVLVERETGAAPDAPTKTITFKRTNDANSYRTEDGRFELTSTGVYGDPIKLYDTLTEKTITVKSMAEAKAAAASM